MAELSRTPAPGLSSLHQGSSDWQASQNGSPSVHSLVHHSVQQRSKVVATIGPASQSEATIEELIVAGARVFRLNFSHGSAEEHAERALAIRRVSGKLGVPVAILQDLSGPKMRIGSIGAEELTIPGGSELLLCEEGAEHTGPELKIPIPDLPLHTVKPSDRVLLADGRVVLTVTENLGRSLRCAVVATGVIRSRSGIAFPDSDFDLPATTEKDLTDLRHGLEMGVNYVALSFVSGPEDVARVRSILEEARSPVRIISKIERAKALERLDEILAVSDGIMVARGDLGIDIPLEDVPLAQDRMVRCAREHQIPAIVATQMLETMMHEPRPTRAEVTDVFFAAKLASDGLMLSGETAVGAFPVAAVGQMQRGASQGARAFEELRQRIDAQHHGNTDLVPGDFGVGRWAAQAAYDPSIVAIAVCTSTGKSARLVSSHRPKLPIFAITTSQFAAETCSLLWGVTPLVVAPSTTAEEEVRTSVAAVRPYVDALIAGNATLKGLRPAVLVVSGAAPGVPGSTSMMQKVIL